MISKNLVLVSQSPRRRELMSLLRVPFKIASPLGEEVLDVRLSFEDQIKEVARAKALSVMDEYKNSVLISADTVIVFEGEVLGKPKDEEDAFKMLKRLAGHTHEVITGVCIASKKRCEVFSNISKVTFYPMSDQEIQDYVATKEPLGRSGSYAIQGGAALFTKEVVGDYFSIMGLPIAEVYQQLISKNW